MRISHTAIEEATARAREPFAASSSAYGESEVLPKVETMPVLPQSPYAANKVAGEAMMRAYARSYDLDAVSLRYFNIFGPRQNSNSAYAGVIAGFARKLVAGERPIITGDGTASSVPRLKRSERTTSFIRSCARVPRGGVPRSARRAPPSGPGRT